MRVYIISGWCLRGTTAPLRGESWHPASEILLCPSVRGGHPVRGAPTALLGGADDPDGVGEGDDAEEGVAGDREGDDEDVEDQVDAELEADAVFDGDGEGREEDGKDDEEEGGHAGFINR